MISKGRIFVVDDNPYSAGPLEDLLQRNGYEVARAARGEEALGAIPRFRPDLILADVVLPDIDGFALCRRLDQDPASRDVPVIFMSALDHEETKIKSLEQGGIDFIPKPFDSREVLARVERHATVSRVRTALRDSEAKFRSVTESAIDAIVSADAAGRILSWNRAAMALFGFIAEEALGQSLEIIIPPRFREAHRKGLFRVASGGPSKVIGSTVEVAAIRKDGSEFPIELSLATWVLDEQRYFTGIIRDISERKEAEQKFRSVTESAIDAIISADARGRIVSWNGAATEILGYTAEEAVGQPLEIIIPERFRGPHRAGLSRVARGGDTHVIGRTVELQARTKSGAEVPIELSLSTWTVHDERYFTGIIRDISERKQADRKLRLYAEELARQHEELALAQGQLVESEKLAMVGRLAAGILHEVNTPVGVLSSATDTLNRVLETLRRFVTLHGELDGVEELLRALDVGQEMSQVLNTSGHRIQEVVNGLAKFVSLDGAERTTFDLRDGFRSVLAVIRSQAGERVHWCEHFAADPVLVHGDPARLNQAFLNLLQNATEAINDDGGEIRVSVESRGTEARVEIADTGHGMTSEELAKAFDFHFTRKNGRIRLGLGLAATRRTVEEAGGTLELESAPGKGTKACVSLPRIPTMRRQTPTESARNPQTRADVS